ncbi:MAG: hypothetical protein JWN46_1953 [Acidimicrobiales bacterium]|nr:hypothetical protein [Acidimicrobiales bacterium]
MWFLITFVVIGLLAGLIARAIVPGPDPLGIVGTIVLGMVGSLIGGFLGYLLFHKDVGQHALQPSGLLGSIIGAVIALLVYRRLGHGSRGRLAR